MRIGLDYTAAIHQSAGIGRYVRDLTAALAEHEPLALFVAGAKKDALPPAPAGCEYRPSLFSLRNHQRMWDRMRLPIPVETWTGPLDVFHATDFTLPPVRRGTKTVLTIHDLAFERYPEETMPGMLSYLKQAVPRAVARADHIIAVSEATRADLIELYGTPSDKVSVIPHGVSAQFFKGEKPWNFRVTGRTTEGAMKAFEENLRIRTTYKIGTGGYILTVGTLQPRKNHLQLIRAFARLRPKRNDDPFRLVIAGGKGWLYDEVMAEIKRHDLPGPVIFTGFVPEADLPALYRRARVFVYPSLYEGFGMPVLEAMACGVPVVASTTPALAEVAGEAALLVKPNDPTGMSRALDRLWNDWEFRDTMIEKGQARAAEYTWARAAGLTMQVYQRLLEEK
jgi:glycosyltransferase involved in cell wall biosynthesis